MDEQTLAQWGDLHRRYVLGEPMSDTERAAYQAGCDELDAEEKLDGDLPRLRELHEQVLQARAVRRQQLEREIALEAEIAELQARLDVHTRRLLGIEN